MVHLMKLTSVRKLISALLVASFMLMLPGCSRKNNTFPEIDSPVTDETLATSETSATVDDDSDNNVEFNMITVALPYSQTTIEYLSKLYYAKQNNLLASNETGANVSLDYLSTINTPWFVSSIQTSSVGVSSDNIAIWAEEGVLPDLYLAEDITEAITSGYAVAMDDYLYNNNLIVPSNTYLGALEYCSDDDLIYGIPHYASTSILAINLDYLPESGVLGYEYSANELSDYLADVSGRYNTDLEEDDVRIVPMVDAWMLAPFLGSALDTHSHPYMFYGEDIASSLVNSVISYIQNLYTDELSDSVDINGMDPRYSRVAATWVIDSNEMNQWDEFYPGRMYYLPLPTANGGTSSPVLDLYPICLSTESANSEFAVNFATFISLDADAQMLIRRLEPQIGFYPLTSNSVLWMYIKDETNNGHLASYFESLMGEASYKPDASVISNIQSYLSAYFAINDNEESTDTFSLNDCYGG